MKVESLADLAKRHIELWIIKGDYQPGEKLKEEEISLKLGISRPPIREAFKTLEAEGLVVRRPRRGAFVSEMSQQDVWEAYTLKAVLYEMAAGLAFEAMGRSHIRRLDAIVAAMEACLDSRLLNLLQYQALHREFHDIIMTVSGNQRLKKISASLHNQVSRFSYRSLQNGRHLASSVRHHRAIVNAFKAGDKPLVCRLMKAHVLEALDVCLRFLGPGAEERPIPFQGEKDGVATRSQEALR